VSAEASADRCSLAISAIDHRQSCKRSGETVSQTSAPACVCAGSIKKLRWIPAAPVRTPDGAIALRRNGKPWRDGEQLQKQSSNFPHALEAKGLVQPGLILHRLRVSFAASIKRQTRANDSTVPAALGDRDTRMGLAIPATAAGKKAMRSRDLMVLKKTAGGF